MKFSESHEWVKLEDDTGTVGVTHHAQGELGDIVYVELPEIGSTIKAGEEAAVLESTKAAADVYSPVSGEVVAVNDALEDQPESVNQEAEGNGWLFKLRLTAPQELESLMDEAAYKEFVGAKAG